MDAGNGFEVTALDFSGAPAGLAGPGKVPKLQPTSELVKLLQPQHSILVPRVVQCCVGIFVVVASAWIPHCDEARAALVLDEPLQGSTTGTRSGGAFVAGGWHEAEKRGSASNKFCRELS
jgi:hypothetical protein